MKKNSFGFTLMEILIVVLVLSIVAAAAIPAVNNSLHEMKLDSATREIISAIQYTQSLAIKEGGLYGVKFTEGSDKFNCFINVSGQVITNPIDKKPYEVDFRANGFLQGVDIVNTTFAVPNNELQFNSLGEPDSNGTVVVSYGGLKKTVTVYAPTGRISVH